MNEATTTVPLAHLEINISEKDIARFWSKVNKDGPTMPGMESPCWIWTRGTNSKGYGIGRAGRKNISTHRLAWMIANGPIPHDGSYHGICVCHRCDNPACCRFDHLFLGTAADNMADRDTKRRYNPQRGDQHHSRRNPERLARGDANGSRTKPECLPRGEASKTSKLTDAIVIDIRTRYAAGGITQKQLAAQFGVCFQLISQVVLRKIWRHI